MEHKPCYPCYDYKQKSLVSLVTVIFGFHGNNVSMDTTGE